MAKKQFLYENVYNDLKQKIECGDLKPGDKLAVEEDMIAHYGVSAITVKKALNLLADYGGDQDWKKEIIQSYYRIILLCRQRPEMWKQLTGF